MTTRQPDPLAESTEIIDTFLAGRRIDTPVDAIRVLCALQSEVAQSGVVESFPALPADCFCGHGLHGLHGWTFENGGDVLRWIVETVRWAVDHEISAEARPAPAEPAPARQVTPGHPTACACGECLYRRTLPAYQAAGRAEAARTAAEGMHQAIDLTLAYVLDAIDLAATITRHGQEEEPF